jgi:uncharacterized hydrophobic protein (TIGR00271 family)
MLVEMKGLVNTVFLITVPGPAVSTILSHLRRGGIGVSVGRIILSSLDYVKPDLSKPLTYVSEETQKLQKEATDAEAKKKGTKPLKGFEHFQKARKTSEELYNEISTQANMTINTWLNLIGASVMAAGGLTTNTTVFIVAAMLVSPIMGPILGMTFGYRIADWPLFKIGFINEVKMAFTAFLVGIIGGFILGDVGKTYKWPNSAMMPEGQAFNMVISIVVSAAAGTVLGVSLTSTGGNALVGTAISAGLLPPLVNAGMMISYAMTYAPKETKSMFYSTGSYALTFYTTHVFTIVVFANFVFWLKDIDPRFREGDDSNFHDIPSLVAHKQRLEAQGAAGGDDKLGLTSERAKAEFFFNHIKDDVKDIGLDIKDRVTGFANLVTAGLFGEDRAAAGNVPKTTRYKPYSTEGEVNQEIEMTESESWKPFKPEPTIDEEASSVADPALKPTSPSSAIAITSPSLPRAESSRKAGGQYQSILSDDVDVELGKVYAEEETEGEVLNPIIHAKQDELDEEL